MAKDDNKQAKSKTPAKPKDNTVVVNKNLTIKVKDGKEIRVWKGMEVGPENHSRPRVGKTAKDRASGAMARNASNKVTRASWMNDNKRSASNFPYNTCNGKKNRSVYTGKGNEQIRLVRK